MFIYLYSRIVFMNKKGIELSINSIVIIILALLVLVVLFFVIQKGISDGTNKYFNFSESAEKEITSDKTCAKMFSGRVCLPGCDSKTMVDWGTDWTDCKGAHCCEKL